MDPSACSAAPAERKYKGVRKRKWGRWVSEIRLPNSRERIWLGSYDAPEKAARAFDAAVVCLRGRRARLNFPHTPPQIPGSSRSLTPQQIQSAAARYANAEPLPRPTQATTTTTITIGESSPALSVQSKASSEEEDALDWSFMDVITRPENEAVGFSDINELYYGFSPRPANAMMGVDTEFAEDNGVFGTTTSSFLWNF